MIIRSEDLDFTHATRVISGALKFLIPTPVAIAGVSDRFNGIADREDDGGFSDTPKTVSVRNGKLHLYCSEDRCYKLMKTNKEGVTIINQVNEMQARKIDARIRSTTFDPTALSLKEFYRILCFVEDELGLCDIYESDRTFIRNKMTVVGSNSEIEAYGWHKRDDRDICLAIYIPGCGEFEGPASTPQKFDNGAVIVRQSGSVDRLIQPARFEETYKHADGSSIKVSHFPNWSQDDFRFASFKSVSFKQEPEFCD